MRLNLCCGGVPGRKWHYSVLGECLSLLERLDVKLFHVGGALETEPLPAHLDGGHWPFLQGLHLVPGHLRFMRQHLRCGPAQHSILSTVLECLHLVQQCHLHLVQQHLHLIHQLYLAQAPWGNGGQTYNELELVLGLPLAAPHSV